MQEIGPFRRAVLRIEFGVVTGFLGTLAVLASLISRRASLWVVHLWGRAGLRIAGAPVTVDGLDNNAEGQRYVIMANHESGLDIPVLLAALPRSVELRFLAKKSLFKVPFLGWAMRASGFIPVDREDRSTAAAMLAQTIAEVTRGGSPLVFPEETWTLDGRLLPFARGGFLVALKTGLPILPVGLEGPRLVLPPDEGVIRPGSVKVRIGSPLRTEGRGVSQRRELTSEVRREIDRLRGAEGHLRDDPQKP
jgi:1-acyl-sn-glycerol-3-phosphate acyltransferase